MKTLDYTEESISFEEFEKLINTERKKGTWYSFVGFVDGKKVAVKGYETWLQVYNVDGTIYPCAMELSVKQFNKELGRPFT